MSSLSTGIFNTIFRHNQVFLGAVFLSAFGFEMALSVGGDRTWDYINKGRQWKDIKHRYVQSEDDE